jgi:hypothetical protein
LLNAATILNKCFKVRRTHSRFVPWANSVLCFTTAPTKLLNLFLTIIKYDFTSAKQSKAVPVTAHRCVPCEVRTYLYIKSKAIPVTAHRCVPYEVRTYLYIKVKLSP